MNAFIYTIHVGLLLPADMSCPVDKHIIEQRWRKEGPLDLLVRRSIVSSNQCKLIVRQMERIHQMHVVPDIVPELCPSFDLRISFPDHQTKTSSKGLKHSFVEPGSYLLPEQVSFITLSSTHHVLNTEKTTYSPRLHKDVFHTDERLYALIMVDPGERA